MQKEDSKSGMMETVSGGDVSELDAEEVFAEEVSAEKVPEEVPVASLLPAAVLILMIGYGELLTRITML